MKQQKRLAIIAAVSDSEILNSNLKQSSIVKDDKIPLHTVREAKSASYAYNDGIDHFQDKDILIFVHQDVYLPKGWRKRLDLALESFDQVDPNWAVLGVFGQTANGEKLGHVWDSGLNCELGNAFSTPKHVQTLDELILIVNAKHGLRFDSDLPGFHLYGTDLCMAASLIDTKSYVIDAPVVHNSKRTRSLGGDYARAYKYLQKKWWRNLPLMAPCSPITKWGTRYCRIRFGLAYRRVFGLIPNNQAGSRNPIKIAQELGYE